MTAHTIIGVCVLVTLLGISVYLLFQVPAVFAIGGIVALVAILAAIGHDAPGAL